MRSTVGQLGAIQLSDGTNLAQTQVTTASGETASLAALVLLFILSLLCIFVQAGCYAVASGIGKATNGSGDVSGPMGIVAVSVTTCLIWGFILFAIRRQI